MIMDYIIFRVYKYYERKERGLAKTSTIGFVVILMTTVLYTLFFIANGFLKFFRTPESPDPAMKYYIGITLCLILYPVSIYLTLKRTGKTGLPKLERRFKNREKVIPLWIIFITPAVLFIVTPIVYGLINGTLRFPAF